MLISHPYCMTIKSQWRGLYLTQADRGFSHLALSYGTRHLFRSSSKKKCMDISHCPPKFTSPNDMLLPLTIHWPQTSPRSLPNCKAGGSAGFIHPGEEEKWVLVRMSQICLEGAEKQKRDLTRERTEHVRGPREGCQRRRNLKGERRRVRKSKN